MKPIQTIIAIALFFALTLTACSSASPTSPATATEPSAAPATLPPTAAAAPHVLPSPTPLPAITATLPPAAPPAAKLQGAVWQMQSYRDAQGATKALISGSQVDVTFTDDGNLGGSGGCNRYNASYQIIGIALQISPIASTMMACLEPEGIMVQESAYLAALQSAVAYRTGETSLELLDADAQVVATYQMASGGPQRPAVLPTAPSYAGLLMNEWQLASYLDVQGAQRTLLPASQITALFDMDGKLSGLASCNTYNASYQASSDTLQITAPVSTRKMCPEPPALMQQEAAYLAALQKVAAYRLVEPGLQLLDAAGQSVLVFLPATVTSQPPAFSVQPPASGADVPPSLTVNGLQNATYPNDFVAARTLILVGGEYHEPAAPGSASETVVKLGEWVAYGELADGTPVAAVILLTNSGGSGTFFQLHLMRDASGQAVSLASTFLGDRVKINSLKLDGDKIVVDMVVQGPQDAMCCPTKPVVDTYAYQGGQLVKVSSQSAEGLNLVGATWQWVELQGMDDTTLKVPVPSQYTLEFKADGTLAVKADCNSGGGAYTNSGPQLKIDIQVITLAACAPESLSNKYLQYLSQIVSYVIQDGGLFLALPMDGGILKFIPAE